MAKPTVMVKEYKDSKAFNKDAAKLARDGWQVTAQSERTQKKGVARTLAGGFLFFGKKPLIVVTYTRAA